MIRNHFSIFLHFKNPSLFKRLFQIFQITVLFICNTCCPGNEIFDGKATIIPNIPYEAEILRFKDGEETLIIQSNIHFEKDIKCGWIIPLPDETNIIEPFSSGAINTLTFCFSPVINRDIIWNFVYLSTVLIIINIIVLRLKNISFKLCIALLIITGLIFVLLIIIPLSLRGRECGNNETFTIFNERYDSGILNHNSGIIGSYKFDILKADNHQKLNDWLKENDFNLLNEKEELIIKYYIHNNWKFAMVRHNGVTGEFYAKPQPICFTFDTEVPVYPIRINRFPHKQSDVYLYVIADQKAKIGGFKSIFSDEIISDLNNPIFSEDGIIWRSKNYEYRATGHKSLLPLFWDGCILTVFRSLNNNNLSLENNPIRFEKPCPYLLKINSKDAAISKAIFYPLVILSLILVVCHIVLKKYAFIISKCKNIYNYIYITFLFLLITNATITYKLFPTLENMRMKIVYNYVDYAYPTGWQSYYIPNMLRNDKIDLLNISKDDLVDYIIRNDNLKVRKSSAKIIYEDSPGNFTLDKDKNGEWIITVYDVWGNACESILKY